MATERKSIQVNPESELGLVLKRAAAAGEPVLVDTGDALFELAVHPATSGQTKPSPEQVARAVAGIRRASGGWKDLVDADAFTAYIYERRRIANRPPVKL